MDEKKRVPVMVWLPEELNKYVEDVQKLYKTDFMSITKEGVIITIIKKHKADNGKETV